MVTPDSLSAWLRDQSLPLVLILLVIFSAVLILRVSARRRREKLMKEREGVSEQTFSSHMERYGFDRQITSATYHYLQETQLVDFPILPGDALDEDLGLDSEDIQQTVYDLTHTLGREPHLGSRSTPIVTVEDLVRLLQASPRKTLRAA